MSCPVTDRRDNDCVQQAVNHWKKTTCGQSSHGLVKLQTNQLAIMFDLKVAVNNCGKHSLYCPTVRDRVWVRVRVRVSANHSGFQTCERDYTACTLNITNPGCNRNKKILSAISGLSRHIRLASSALPTEPTGQLIAGFLGLVVTAIRHLVLVMSVP